MSKKHGTAFPTFQLKGCCEGYFAQCVYLQAMELATVGGTQPWRLAMPVRPDPQSSPAGGDGESYILRQRAAAGCARSHLREREPPSRETCGYEQARHGGCSVAPQHPARRAASRV